MDKEQAKLAGKVAGVLGALAAAIASYYAAAAATRVGVRWARFGVNSARFGVRLGTLRAYRRCPNCRKVIRGEAKVCPSCRIGVNA